MPPHHPHGSPPDDAEFCPTCLQAPEVCAYGRLHELATQLAEDHDVVAVVDTCGEPVVGSFLHAVEASDWEVVAHDLPEGLEGRLADLPLVGPALALSLSRSVCRGSDASIGVCIGPAGVDRFVVAASGPAGPTWREFSHRGDRPLSAAVTALEWLVDELAAARPLAA